MKDHRQYWTICQGRHVQTLQADFRPTISVSSNQTAGCKFLHQHKNLYIMISNNFASPAFYSLSITIPQFKLFP